MQQPNKPLQRHQETVDELVSRLAKKGHGSVQANVVYGTTGPKNPIGELDVFHEEWRNGRQYLTYYEVKTGENVGSAMDKARQQADNFFRHYPAAPGAKKTVVYVHKDYGVQRWTE